MQQESAPAIPGTAPLRNMAAFAALMERVTKRGSNLPGMAAFYGESGMGKSFSAAYAANKYRAYYVQVKSVWTRKHFCIAILREMGFKELDKLTIPMMVEMIAEQLAKSQQPLIVDEADFLVQRGMIEVLRDIYESSLAPIILIGEENLPNTLKRWERVHNRMLDWVKAKPCNEADCRQLAKVYCAGVSVSDDLLEKVRVAVDGCTRRVCINLDHIREFAEGRSLTEIDAAAYKGRIDTGTPGRNGYGA